MEKFAEYLNQDGLVSKLTTYDDTARESIIKFIQLLLSKKAMLTRPALLSIVNYTRKIFCIALICFALS